MPSNIKKAVCHFLYDLCGSPEWTLQQFAFQSSCEMKEYVESLVYAEETFSKGRACSSSALMTVRILGVG